MTRKAIFGKALLVAIISLGTLGTGQMAAAETPVSASCMAESPTDGSVWMGTNGQGLYRLGRNGRQIKYTADEGKIPSDSIKTLFFDAQNVLWILDAKGSFTTYSATSGFEIVNGLGQGISCAIYDKKSDCIYFSSGKSLKTYKNVSKKTSELASLPSPAKSLKLAENGGNFLWIFCQNGALKVGLDGSIQSWEDAPEVLDLLPFEFETNRPSAAIEGNKSGSIWGLILKLALALLAGLAVGWSLKKRAPAKAPVQAPMFTPTPAVQKPKEPVTSTTVINTPRPQTQIQPETKPQVQTQVPLQPQVKVEPQPKQEPETVKPVETEEVKTAPVAQTPKAEEKTPAAPRTEENKPVRGPFTKKVYAIIKEHLSEPDFDVESIASITGMSRIHVNRKLRQEGAPAPSALIKEARMHHAVRLIRQGKLGMSQISSLCGFRTPSYFATAFKEFYGVSPSEFTEGK